MGDQGRWFKLWVSSIHDPELDNLSVSDFGRWAKLGAITKEQGVSGRLEVSPPARTLLAALQLDEFDDLVALISRLPNVTIAPCAHANAHVDAHPNAHPQNCNGAHVVTFAQWAKYQVDSTTSERVRRYRCNGLRREEKRGEEKRRELPPTVPQKGDDFPPKFVEFWEGYPKKRDKPRAWKAWKRLSPSDQLADQIIARVQRDQQTDQWSRDGGAYIPYPASYLNGRRFEDEEDVKTISSRDRILRALEGGTP